MINCYVCDQPFKPGPRDFQYATGWIQPLRKQGGANALARSKQFDRWAHWECIKYPGQKALL